MLKRFACGMSLLGILVSGAAGGIFDRLAINLFPESVSSLDGRYRNDANLKDMVMAGPGFGLGLRYKLGDHFFIDGSFSYNWMYFRGGMRPSGYKDEKPAFCLPIYSLNLTYSPISGRFVEPYLTVGGGVCPWWFGSAPFGGVLFRSPENEDETLTMISKSVNAGLGLEFMIGSKISFFTEGKYYLIFADDENKFGSGMLGNQGVLGIRAGFTFYFQRKHGRKTLEEFEQ